MIDISAVAQKGLRPVQRFAKETSQKCIQLKTVFAKAIRSAQCDSNIVQVRQNRSADRGQSSNGSISKHRAQGPSQRRATAGRPAPCSDRSRSKNTA